MLSIPDEALEAFCLTSVPGEVVSCDATSSPVERSFFYIYDNGPYDHEVSGVDAQMGLTKGYAFQDHPNG